MSLPPPPWDPSAFGHDPKLQDFMLRTQLSERSKLWQQVRYYPEVDNLLLLAESKVAGLWEAKEALAFALASRFFLWPNSKRTARAKSVTTLIGPPGVGKSTLIRAMTESYAVVGLVHAASALRGRDAVDLIGIALQRLADRCSRGKLEMRRSGVIVVEDLDAIRIREGGGESNALREDAQRLLARWSKLDEISEEYGTKVRAGDAGNLHRLPLFVTADLGELSDAVARRLGKQSESDQRWALLATDAEALAFGLLPDVWRLLKGGWIACCPKPDVHVLRAALDLHVLESPFSELFFHCEKHGLELQVDPSVCDWFAKRVADCGGDFRDLQSLVMSETRDLFQSLHALDPADANAVLVKASEDGLVYERVFNPRWKHRAANAASEVCGTQDFPDYAPWPGRTSHAMPFHVAQRRAELNVLMLGPGELPKSKTFWAQFLKRYQQLPHVVVRLTELMIERRVTVDELAAAAEGTGWLLPWSWISAVEQRRCKEVEDELRRERGKGCLSVPFDAPYFFGDTQSSMSD